jgi:hypothetical protein
MIPVSTVTTSANSYTSVSIRMSTSEGNADGGTIALIPTIVA